MSWSVGRADGLVENMRTLIEFVPLQAAPGLTILTGGKLVYGAQGPRMQCAPGEQLVYNISSFSSTFKDWVIDCTRVIVAANGSNLTFVNPTCAQLQYGDSPLQVMACAGLPISPSVLMTTGTTRCVPCAGDLYSLEWATKNSNRTISTFQCYLCPYGASEYLYIYIAYIYSLYICIYRYRDIANDCTPS